MGRFDSAGDREDERPSMDLWGLHCNLPGWPPDSQKVKDVVELARHSPLDVNNTYGSCLSPSFLGVSEIYRIIDAAVLAMKRHSKSAFLPLDTR